jgi:Tfp pilus assembly protein PilE
MKSPDMRAHSFQQLKIGAGRATRGDAQQASGAKSRRGAMLFELMIVGIVLGAAMLVTVPTLGLMVRERRTTEQRQRALAEASNILERLVAQPWERIVGGVDQNGELAANLQRQFPGAQLHVSVQPVPDETTVKRVTVELSWNDQAGRRVSPVRLTTWVHRPRRNAS